MIYDRMKNLFQLIDSLKAVKNNRKRYKDKLANSINIQELEPLTNHIVNSLNSFPNTTVTLVSINEAEISYTNKGISNFIQFNTIDFTEAEFLKVMWDVTMEDYGDNVINMAAIVISCRLQPIYISRNDNETWAIYYTLYWKSYNKTENDLYLSVLRTTVERLLKIKGK